MAKAEKSLDTLGGAGFVGRWQNVQSTLIVLRNAAFRLFVAVFPRPTLGNQDLNRVATVVADYFAASIICASFDLLMNFNRYTAKGLQNVAINILILVAIRYYAKNGRVKFAVSLYALSVVFFYVLVSARIGYFEHMQASGTLIVVGFATLTLGPLFGLYVLLGIWLVFWILWEQTAVGALTALQVLLPDVVSRTRQEMNVLLLNTGKMYLFCTLVSAHIFSQLSLSLIRERSIAADEEKARIEADRANREKTRFIAAASHDFRQPVSALALNFETFLNDHPEVINDPAIKNIESSVDTLNRMLESILTVSKLQANVLRPTLSSVSINSVLQRCYKSNIAAATAKHLHLRVRPTNLYCSTDGDMLFRALNNIVENAVKYTTSGSIFLGVRRRYGGYAICVMDSGIGIPADAIDKIYDEFTMLVDSSRKSASSGLGLYIVKGMADLLGIPIHTHSTVGVGSTFYLELPDTYVAPVSNPSASPEEVSHREAEEPKPTYRDLQGLLVGVVDDVDNVRTSICGVLRQNGLRTVDAANWDDLKIGLRQETPDLLITDYKLENDVTGYDVILAARKHFSESLRCFIITGDTSPDLVHEMSQRGVDVCYKPLSGKALLQVMEKQLLAA